MNQQLVLKHTPLMILINLLGFRQVSHDITNHRFPESNRLWSNYKVFRFKKNISPNKVVKEMRSQGFEPANSHELVLWEGHNNEEKVVALGSIVSIEGYSSALFLDKNGTIKDLYLIGLDFPCGHNRFLAVCEMSAD